MTYARLPQSRRAHEDFNQQSLKWYYFFLLLISPFEWKHSYYEERSHSKEIHHRVLILFGHQPTGRKHSAIERLGGLLVFDFDLERRSTGLIPIQCNTSSRVKSSIFSGQQALYSVPFGCLRSTCNYVVNVPKPAFGT